MGGNKENMILITVEIKQNINFRREIGITLYEVNDKKGYCINIEEKEGFKLEFFENQEGFIKSCCS